MAAVTVLRAGWLFDGTGSALAPDPAVMIDGAGIVAVTSGREAPDGASIVDYAGATLLPGLIDTHVHLAFDATHDPVGALSVRSDAEVIESMTRAARDALRGGVTTVRDLGDRDYLSLGLRGQPGLPTIIASGPPITTPRGHCFFLGGGVEPTADAVRSAVREHAERGVDVIKVMASGGTMTPGTDRHAPQFPVEVLRAVTEEAHRLGLAVTMHAHATGAIADTVAAGTDGIEHVTFWTEDGIEAPEDLIRLIADRRIVAGLTMGIGSDPPFTLFAANPEVAARMPGIVAATRRLYQAGAIAAFASDAGISTAKPHDAVRRAPAALRALGASQAEALRAVTSGNAAACGLSDRKGRIAPGFDADILVVDGDPIADPEALHRIRAVYARGVPIALLPQIWVLRGAMVRCYAPLEARHAVVLGHAQPVTGSQGAWAMKVRRVIAIPIAVLLAGATAAAANLGAVAPAAAAASPPQHAAVNCEYSALCAEVANSSEVFGSEYVGHDEPSALFYSNVPGSGNHMTYSLRLPRDPSPVNPNTPGKSYEFQLDGSIWFGMALCATQSYPEQVSTCTPDSDSNIVDPAVSPKHPGTAFLELQLYPPGWVPWPTWQVATGASGCDPTRWCAAMNIFSLAEDPVAGTTLNSTCVAKVGSIEYFNFAFLTKDGHPTAPANPVDSTTATFTPDLNRDLLMNSGDNLSVSLGDTPNGLRAVIRDHTTGQTGSMTASAANGFGQVQYDPTGTSCVNLPYNFHPMYSTSSEQTRVIWSAHSYNISFTSEIGHFENCEGPNPIPATPFGLDPSGNPVTCPAGNTEGFGSNASPTDSDDDFCFPGTEAMRIHINGCTDTNTGFDSLSYQPVWPDGNTLLHPQTVLFSSPRTGPGDRVNYSRVALEANLPRIEPGCNRTTGAGCTLIPTTDKGTPAAFYPFFSAFQNSDHNPLDDVGCRWGFGNVLPGATTNFGRNAQYGSLLSLSYLVFGGGGTSHQLINNFRQILNNPCPAGGDQDQQLSATASGAWHQHAQVVPFRAQLERQAR